MNTEDVVQWALKFATQGFHVFPLLKRFVSEKNRIGTPKGWAHNRPEDPHAIPSTNDVNEIAAWSAKYTDLIGYGVHPKNRIGIIFDIDVKNGHNGLPELQNLLEAKLLTLNTFIVKTKSGGLHLYYYSKNLPKGYVVKNQAGFREGIDIRGESGFVVGPTTEGPYKVKRDLKIAQISDTIIEILKKDEGLKLVDDSPDLAIQLDDGTKIISEEHENSLYYGIIPEVIHMGERDDIITRLIGAWSKKFKGDRSMIIELCKIAVSRMEQAPGNKFTVQDAIEKIDRTVKDKNFLPNNNDKLMEFMHENLIFLSNSGAIFDRSDKNNPRIIPMKIATNYYKPYKLKLTVEGKSKTVSAFNTWLASKDRLELQSYGYRPNAGSIYFCPIQSCDVANLYRPPIFPTGYHIEDYQEYIDKFLWLMNRLWGNAQDHILDWCAHVVQRPDQKLRFAPLLWSDERGIGKNLFFDILKNVIGKWNAAESMVNKVIGKHANYPLRSHLVLVNETNVDTRDRRGLYNRNDLIEKLKIMISDDVQEVEEKFMPAIQIQSFVNYIMFSNDSDAVPIEEKDRRFEVYRCDSGPLERKDYRLLTEMGENPEGKAINYIAVSMLRQFLMERDIKHFYATSRAMDTDTKRDMIELSKDPTIIELEDAIHFHQSIFRVDIVTFELFSWYINNRIEDGYKIHKNIKVDWFRRLTKKIIYTDKNSKYSDALQLTVDLPIDLTKEHSNGERRRCRFFTVRNHDKYDQINTDEIKRQYTLALEATTTNYKEKDNNVVHLR